MDLGSHVVDLVDMENSSQQSLREHHRSDSTTPIEIQEILRFGQDALDAGRKDDPRHATQLHDLARGLCVHFQKHPSSRGLDLAANIMKLVVATTSLGHDLEVLQSIQLARCLSIRRELNLHQGCSSSNTINELASATQTLEANISLPADRPVVDHNYLPHGGLLQEPSNLVEKRLDHDLNVEEPESTTRSLDIANHRALQEHTRRGAQFDIDLRSDPLRSLEGGPKECIGSVDSIDDFARLFDVGFDVEAQNQQKKEKGAYLKQVLAGWLSKRFPREGFVTDLAKSVKLMNDAVQDTSKSDAVARIPLLLHFGNSLGMQHARTGATEDNVRSIEVVETAIRILPPGYPWEMRTILLMRYAGSLFARFRREGKINDLNLAIESMEKAIEAAPRKHEAFLVYSSYLAILIGSRYRETQCADDLNAAIAILEKAIASLEELRMTDQAPHYNMFHGIFGCHLGEWLEEKYDRTKSVDDLNRAIDVLSDAARTQTDSDRAYTLEILGNCLGKRHDVQELGTEKDYHRRIYCYLECWKCVGCSPSVRIYTAQCAALLLGQLGQWKEASDVLEGAMELLPTVSPRSLQNSDKQHMLQKSVGLGSFAAAAAFNAGKSPSHALRMLELGRGIMAGLLLETRAETTTLKADHPTLAERFEYLRDKLDPPARKAHPPSVDSDLTVVEGQQQQQQQQRRALDEEFQQVLQSIRAQPSFEDFPFPTMRLDVLQAAASTGPIAVVNTTGSRCDAILIDSSGIRHLPLPNLEHSEIMTACGKEISLDLLEMLWDYVACPILEKLGFLGRPEGTESWPRLWWVPVGPLSRLPLHAAGRHYAGSSETVLDRVVSSYSTSIKALLYSRQTSKGKNPQDTSQDAALISMTTTPPGPNFAPSPLKFAGKEIHDLKGLLSPRRPRDIASRKQDILHNIKSCSIFHFAGHGISDLTDPSKSRLLLEDWVENPLTVNDLTALNLSNESNSSWIAYLSACSTGESHVERLYDETIHLMSACQLAGFPHVVGSLWKVDDEYSSEAACEVYETMKRYNWTDEAVGLGVHNAARLLRERTRGGNRIYSRAGSSLNVDGFEECGGSTASTVERTECTESLGTESWGRGASGRAVRNEGNPAIWAAYIHVGP
ncbi:TPR domain containing protein [Colletotrichum plurivorum]|uniref:TPR domain containing protein n=1 Tax=Colletotrichum plurivorum TaxID=2175906 RepID=A0A8H6JQA5_9PEZI|nr:TPR domain containing protein [Colletotrichum plurivorum]